LAEPKTRGAWHHFKKYVREFRERQHVFVFFDLVRQAAVVDDDPKVGRAFEIGDESLELPGSG